MNLERSDLIQEELRHAGEKISVPVFKDIGAEEGNDVTVIESLCTYCHEQGVTRLLLTRVPFFKEIILSSFECPHCCYKDTEIQSAGRIQEKGVRIILQISTKNDLNRQVVKSGNAVVKIPCVDFEIPARKGNLTTIEGLIVTACEDLALDQADRWQSDPGMAAKIDEFISKLKHLLEAAEPYSIIVDDPTGNSYVENPHAPARDNLLHTIHYRRTAKQDEELGITQTSADDTAEPCSDDRVPRTSATPAAGEPGVAPVQFSDEVLEFGTNCTRCNSPCKTNMKIVDIPHFKEVIIMAMVCDNCGYRDNEVKSAAGIAPKGIRMTLRIMESIDLSRDVLKSDTASVSIPELDLHLMEGTLGGKFTTVEGLLLNVRDQLKETNFSFMGVDSADTSRQIKIDSLCQRLDAIATGQESGVHLVVDDPAGNSYIQNIYEPSPDTELKIDHYQRSQEQDEELGLNDMNTENYSST